MLPLLLIPLLIGAGTFAAGAFAVRKVNDIISILLIGNEVKKVPNSFKYMLHKAKADGKVVDVGIFNKEEEMIEALQFKSEAGISPDLQFDKMYYV